MRFASVFLQDTVVALQALAYYAAFSGANAIDLKFNISSSASSFVSLFWINSTNYRDYQSQKVAKGQILEEKKPNFMFYICHFKVDKKPKN